MNDPHLNFEKIKYLAIRDKILGDNPDIDDQTLADTVEGLSDLPEILAKILRQGIEAKILAEELKKQMKERLERFENLAKRRRATVSCIMGQAGLNKLTMPDFTAWISHPQPHVDIIDPTLIPEDYIEIRTERHVLKNKIGEALKNRTPVAGAVLSNPEPTLNVRTR